MEVLDAEYKTHHYAIVDLIDDETDLQTEQDTLDTHDESVAQLGIRKKTIDHSMYQVTWFQSSQDSYKATRLFEDTTILFASLQILTILTY